MAETFDPGAIETHGWRQGAVLGPELLRIARDRAPADLVVLDGDWLIVTSHDCDVVNGSFEKEPFVEILRAEVTERSSPDKTQVWGRNPRMMQLVVDDGTADVVLSLKVHERWMIARELLAFEPPVRVLPDKSKRLIAEWLAKRYIRAAFPSEFDRRWRTKMREWMTLLEKYSQYLQGVYLRLNKLEELAPEVPYNCHLIIAVTSQTRATPAWAKLRDAIEREINQFWTQFEPDIQCAGVDVLGTDEIVLAELEYYQRFDADWVSFADDSDVTPSIVDMTT